MPRGDPPNKNATMGTCVHPRRITLRIFYLRTLGPPLDPPPCGPVCCCRSSSFIRYSYAACLRNGEGTAQDLGKAVSLFERLGEEGLLEAKVCRRMSQGGGDCPERFQHLVHCASGLPVDGVCLVYNVYMSDLATGIPACLPGCLPADDVSLASSAVLFSPSLRLVTFQSFRL